MYALVLSQSLVLNQLKLFLLARFYNSLEIETVFYYWWLGHILLDHIGEKNFSAFRVKEMFVLATRLVCNVVIFLTVWKRLLEFRGYQPKTFPLQPPPKKMIPEPRRLSLPPNFPSEWKNIGSKRQKIESEKRKSEFINSEDITNRKIFQQSLSMPAIDT